MKKLFYVLGAVMLLAGCSDEPQTQPGQEDPAPVPEAVPGQEVEITLSAAESRAADATQAFGYDFFAAMSATQGLDKNMVCSPASASILLSMLANASTADTRAEILAALGCDDLDALNSLANKELTQLPLADAQVALKYANAFWYRDRLTLNPAFGKTMADSYDMEAYARKFDLAFTEEVNAWVNDKTKGIIPAILESVPDEECVAILANALYFKGAWANKFDKSDTKRRKFNGINGPTTVYMMLSGDAQFYAEADDFQAVKLKFGSKGYEAIFVLPAIGADFDTFISSGALRRAGEALYSKEDMTLAFPRFKFRSDKMDINGALGLMGIKDINNFRKLTAFTEDVEARHDISQKTGVEFNEEGAEAAAVTVTGMVTAPGPGSGYGLVVQFDRPFIFMIREATTGAILFAGHIVKL